jgi:prepilin signal peptidase PulO-like enzyme (type II secretory pathway)
MERMGMAAVTKWLGTPGWRECLMGVIVCAVVPFVLLPVVRVFFGKDALNIGDLKLLAAVGAMLGFSNTCAALIFALGVSLVYSVVNLAIFGRLNQAVHHGAHRVLEVIYLRKLVTPMPGDAVNLKTHIPMALPLALGVVVLTYWQWHNGMKGGLW